MKRIAFAALATVMAASSAIAEVPSKAPIFVGHRGSAWGTENTHAAFINGGQVYPYLECDVRMTADSVFVISHDESTERLGGNLKVAEATLDQLLKEEYLQKRNGRYYAGRISTFTEYLDDCKATGSLPLIEFKWTPGINSNDCSMIPALIEIVKSYGFDKDCIIITSMKPCLEFVMKNYPQVTCQFLGGNKWKDSLDWILKNKIDVDLIHNSITKEDVDFLHDKGLKVNVWTVDDPERAAELSKMGVDFITTNKMVYTPQAKN